MTRISKLALIAAATAMIATPAFAQSFEGGAGDGTGNVAARHTSLGTIAGRQSGLHSFAMVPGAAPGSDSYGVEEPRRKKNHLLNPITSSDAEAHDAHRQPRSR
jgi:hypothetical protein